MVHQNTPHRFRRNSIEVTAALPLPDGIAPQPQIRFMDQGGGLQRMARTLLVHVAAGHSSQLRINQRHKLIERRLVAVAPLVQQSRDVARRRRNYSNLGDFHRVYHSGWVATSFLS